MPSPERSANIWNVCLYIHNSVLISLISKGYIVIQ